MPKVSTKLPKLQNVGLQMLMVVVLYLGCCTPASAVEPVILDPAQDSFELVRHAEYFIEPREDAHQFRQRLLLPELVSLWQQGRFQPVTTRQIGFGAQWSLIHIRIPITNPEPSPREWMLAFNRWAGTFNSVSLVINDHPLPEQPIAQTLDLLDWAENDVIYHTPFTLPANASGALYVSYSNGASTAPMTIESIEHYNNRRRLEDIYFFSILALIIGIGFLVTLQMIALGQSTAYYYSAYLVSGALWICSTFEYLYRPYFFNGLSKINTIDVFLWGTTISCLFLFQRAFLRSRKISGSWSKWLILLTVLAVLIPAFYHLTGMRYQNTTILSVTLLYLISPVSGLIAIKNHLPGSRPFFLGALLISTSAIVITLAYPLSNTLRLIDGYQFFMHAFLIEAIFFALAMFRQTKAVREEKEYALQAELKATQEKLQLHERLINTAHDIQQPLTALKLASQLPTLSGDKNPNLSNTVEYLEGIVRSNLATQSSSGQQPAQSKLSLDDHHHGHVRPQIDEEAAESFSVNLILQNVVNMFHEEARAKGLKLNAVSSNQQVHASPLVLMRVVSNLVSNAIKNTDQGGVLLGCRYQGQCVRIEVHDSGPGLSAENIQRLQKPYQREGDYEGSGLGLSIVRQLCKKHDLVFNIKSTPGRGSVFSITVPRAISACSTKH